MSEAPNRPGWLAVGGIIACAPGVHASGPTVIDDLARRLTHEERAIAELLAAEGHRVVSVPHQRGGGRTPDLEVCGQLVEIKSFDTLPKRLNRPPTAWHVWNKLLDAEGQAPTVILHARASGLSEKDAHEGVAEYAGKKPVGSVRGVRVVGDGFDLAWSLRLVRDVGLVAVPVPPSGRPVTLGETARTRSAQRQRGLQAEMDL